MHSSAFGQHQVQLSFLSFVWTCALVSRGNHGLLQGDVFQLQRQFFQPLVSLQKAKWRGVLKLSLGDIYGDQVRDISIFFSTGRRRSPGKSNPFLTENALGKQIMFHWLLVIFLSCGFFYKCIDKTKYNVFFPAKEIAALWRTGCQTKESFTYFPDEHIPCWDIAFLLSSGIPTVGIPCFSGVPGVGPTTIFFVILYRWIIEQLIYCGLVIPVPWLVIHLLLTTKNTRIIANQPLLLANILNHYCYHYLPLLLAIITKNIIILDDKLYHNSPPPWW